MTRCSEHDTWREWCHECHYQAGAEDEREAILAIVLDVRDRPHGACTTAIDEWRTTVAAFEEIVMRIRARAGKTEASP